MPETRHPKSFNPFSDTPLSDLICSQSYTLHRHLMNLNDIPAIPGLLNPLKPSISTQNPTKDVYEERAPIRHTDQLSCPILLLQGAEETFSGSTSTLQHLLGILNLVWFPYTSP